MIWTVSDEVLSQLCLLDVTRRTLSAPCDWCRTCSLFVLWLTCSKSLTLFPHSIHIQMNFRKSTQTFITIRLKSKNVCTLTIINHKGNMSCCPATGDMLLENNVLLFGKADRK